MSTLPTPGSTVTLVYAGSVAPVLARATVESVDGDALAFRLLPPRESLPGVEVGAVVIAQTSDRVAAHAFVRLERVEGAVVAGRVDRTPAPDRRSYPRSYGALHVRYDVRRVMNDAEIDEWLHGSAAGSPPYAPDPFMNFSPSGLAFDDLPRAVPGELLLMEIVIPPDPRPHRLTARVMRVEALPADERDEGTPGTHRIAVRFEGVGAGTTEALLRYTVRIQDAYLEGLP